MIVLIPSTLTKVTIPHSLIDALRSVLGSHGFEYGKDYNLIHVRPAFATLTNGLIAATILPVPINYEAPEPVRYLMSPHNLLSDNDRRAHFQNGIYGTLMH